MLTVTPSSAPTITATSSWDDSDDWKSSPSRHTINLRLEQREERSNSQLQAESETNSKVISETDCSDGIGTQDALKSKSNADGTPSRVSMAKRPLPSPPQKRADDLRLNLDVLPQNKDGFGSGVKTVKRDVQSGGLVPSTSMRRIMKFGNRRLIEIRKLMSTNRRQLFTVVACVACIVLISFLMSGEDELNVVTRPNVEHVSLPHVRVNPAFIQPRKTGPNRDFNQGLAH
ncbi:hypothetical protein FGB62_127g15 [Gracilaria domingensis]|nr:hypothetical protein FGB62_127g15 [Gracilaria domingensis]